MVPKIAEKVTLDNVRCSFLCEPPKYKRCKVSAIRDFPPGCGPNGRSTNITVSRVSDGYAVAIAKQHDYNTSMDVEKKKYPIGIVIRPNDSEVFATAENAKQHGDHSLTDDEKNSDVMVTLLPCLNTTEEVADVLGNVASDKKLMESGNFRSDKLSSESTPDYPRSPQQLQVKEIASMTKRSLLESDELLKKTLLEEKEQVSGTGIVAAVKESVVRDQTCSPCHYPIPSDIVWKERSYPRRRRISSIKDFPSGCGKNMSSLVDGMCLPAAVPVKDSHVVRDDMDVENGNSVSMAFLENTLVHDGDDAFHRGSLEICWRDSAEAQAKSEGTFKRLENHVKSSKGEEKLGNSELKNESDVGGQHEMLRYYELDGNEMLEESVTYEDNKQDKKKSPDSKEIIDLTAVSDDVEGRILVLGLPAQQPSWRRGFVAVKSIPSSSGAKCCRRIKSTSKRAQESTSEIPPLGGMLSSGLGELVLGDRRHLFDATASLEDRGARSKVRETLRLFHVLLRKHLQEEETKPVKKRGFKGSVGQLVAKTLKDKGKYVNTGKGIIGAVPGVEVGDEFHYRVELLMIGLHRQPQAGIDYLQKGDIVLATSIVASGRYDNDLDNSDVLIYTGQGGNLTGDQKLERGNLALKNSIDKRNSVRVIRGYKETDEGKAAKIYTYDGLYTVERYWEDRSGPYHKMVFKFELRRLAGQPELAWKEVKKSKKLNARKGLCVEDISQGKEAIPIGAVNTIDDEKPPPFTYITNVMYPSWCNPLPPRGCSCTDRCTDSAECACAQKNLGEIPYNHDGAIVQAKPIVYECGRNCGCPPYCYNRVSQNGIRFPLEIFRTENRGWGVRSLSSIPSGSFICEYLGELLEDKEAEQRTGNDEYLFDIGRNYDDPSFWEGLSDLMPDSLQSSSDVVTDVGFTIDASQYGSVGRFVNHSCSPNLYAQNVLFDHEDERIPHIMLFAAENIPPLQELTYHYNYTIGQVHDKDGNVKIKNCYCGSSECSGRLY